MKAEKINHAERAHAILSASSASRWLECTPSARMTDGMERKTSAHADEGTLAHEYSENLLRFKLGLIDEKSYNKKLREHKAHELYRTNLEDELEPYIILVLEQIAEARATSPDALILIEEKVSLEVYIQKGFGTCDIVIIADGIMYITDLKFGKGVRVSAIDNSQLKLYGLGALLAFGMLYEIETIRLTISQPRLDAISTWDISADELLTWAENVVKPRAELAFEGKGEHTPGDWCRFCDAKPFCPVLKKEALGLAQSEFDKETTPLLIDKAELMEVYLIADRVKAYLDGVQAYIYNSVLSGEKWEGLKVVLSNTHRVIKEEEKAMKLLDMAGYDKSIYTNTKLKGLGDLKKFLGEENRDKILGNLIVKPEGKPTVVPESDPRPEHSGANDFND